MSQNPDDARNNQRNSPPPRRDNSDLHGLNPDFAVPSLMFDEYGEVKANFPAQPGQPPARRRPNDEPPSIPSLIFDEYGELKPHLPDLRHQAAPPPAPAPANPKPAPKPRIDETPSVPSLMFDEYGELKSAVLKNFKPATPPAPDRFQGPVQEPARGPVQRPAPEPVQRPPQGPVSRPNQGPVQPAYNQARPVPTPVNRPMERPANFNQAQPPYVAPIPAPVRPQAAPFAPANPPLKKRGSRVGLALWIAIVVIMLALVGGGVWFFVLNKPANTNPVTLGDLLPFRGVTPGTTVSVPTTPNPTIPPGPTTGSSNVTSPASGESDLDALYNQATTQLNNNQFKEAAATLEQLRDKQTQSGNVKHPDVTALLFKAYFSLGDQLNKSSQLADFQQSLDAYQKALDTAKTLDSKDRDQQEETALQTRLDTGNLYVKAVTAYNEKELDAAIPLFSQLYAKDQNFRDAPGLYYDSLVRIGDGQFAENLLTDAYKSYARAALIKNVADTRYAQARASSIENQLRQAGKEVPTAPNP